MNQYGKNPLYYPNKIISVGDIHGEVSKLESLIKKIKLDPEDHLVFVGDLLGWNGDNLKTLIKLKEIKNNHKNTYFVKGNHDQGLIDFITQGKNGKSLQKTLENLTGEKLHDITPLKVKELLEKNNVIDIFQDMIPYYETEKCIITHAPFVAGQWVCYGGRDYLKNFEEDDVFMGKMILDQMEWELRTTFSINEQEIIPTLDKFLICGHQHLADHVTKEVHRSPRVFKHRAFLDCGCGYREHSKLFALEFPSKKIIKS